MKAKKLKAQRSFEIMEVRILDLQNTNKQQQRVIELEQEKTAVAEDSLAFANAKVSFNEARYAEEHKLDMLWVQNLQTLIHSLNGRLHRLTGKFVDVTDISNREAMARR